MDRDRLVGSVIGKTEEITLAKLEEARGGIFFVDEAYTLNNASDNDFGKIAVNTIMKFMEDNRDDIMVIFAGYTDEMQNFLGLNPGLASRVSNEFNFEEKDYSDCSSDELEVINILREPLSRDEIIRLLNKPIFVTQTILATMEIKGLIKEEMGEIHLS